MFVGDGSHPLDKQFHVGRYFGIPLYIHIILVFFLGFELLSAVFRGSLWLMMWPIIIVLSVYLHELGHALSSAHFGARPHRIVLHLFGGVAEVPGGLRIKQELWVIAWGPIVSFLLMAMGYTVMKVTSPGTLWYVVGLLFFRINLILFLFNILPIYPLDGGQITRQWMTMRMGRDEGIRRSLPWSMAFLIAAGMFGLIILRGSLGVLTLIIAAFLAFYNHQQYMIHRHLFTKGFWGYMNPFGAPKRRTSSRSSHGHLRVVEDEPQGGGLADRWYVWWNRKKAEKIMRKSDEVGIDKLSKEEREILERYLDAKISLRQKKNYMN
ncbi:MAG: hypothetical protein EP343_27740 [Deltaproteobacteria bacterium]|nr:MAG: hypothetical protein EP343_27740 [Deltaproteobacteria bacterium]